MICLSCGADYLETELYCPYCKGENIVEAKRRQLLKLEKIDKDAEDIKKLPKKIVRKSTKLVLVAGGCIAVFGVIAMLFVFGYSNVSDFANYKLQQKHFDQLALYDSEQSYAEIHEYIKKYNLYEPFYQKFMETSDTYYYYSAMCEELEVLENESNKTQDAVRFTLNYGANALFICKNAIADKGILGNEEVLQVFYEKIIASLKTTLQLTNEEIDLLSLKEKEITNNLAITVMERWEYK